MSLKRDEVFKTLEEATSYLFSEECEADILALPPNVDELTDDEKFDDESTEAPDVSDVPGQLEIQIHSQTGDENEGESTEIPKKKKKYDHVWVNSNPQYSSFSNNSEQNLQDNIKSELTDYSVLEIFECFFSNDVYSLIVEETRRYASEYKNKQSINVSIDDIKTFIGFLILSGYHTLPSQKDYWSEDEDLGVKIVKEAFSRNKYLELKSIIHFQDNKKANQNKDDRSFKLRPLFDQINANFKKWGYFHSELSVDEMIVRYYGSNFLKQFIRGKPIRFGYKLWAMCGADGYCYDFSLYGGKAPSKCSTSLSLGEKVVFDCLEGIETPTNHKIFFDNFFTSFHLLTILKDKGFRASGTIRENRTCRCPLMSPKMVEKNPRGYYEFKFDKKNEVTIIRWNDNRSVTLGTNFDFISPEVKIRRYCKKKKEFIYLPQPSAIDKYNKFMGGVDLHDWLLEKHSITIRGKKWYWCLFTRIIDMCIVNTYCLYNIVHGKHSISMKECRRQIAVPYLKLGSRQRREKGRPLKMSSRSKVLPDVRFDEKNHTISKRDNQRRCQHRFCTAKPRTFCKKCNVTLCISCFAPYHTRP